MSDASSQLLSRACRRIPGGVNSPVRAFAAVGGKPIFFERGDGAQLYDPAGRAYTDYVCSWGAMILGHGHPALLAALRAQLPRGLGFGAPSRGEVELAECLAEVVPGLEMVRLVNSGTEAVMSAVRLARGWTGRQRILKFAGCYHGHADALLVKAGSGALSGGQPDSLGVPAGAVQDTLVLEYNDLPAVEDCFARGGEQIAAVLLEPVAGNMGCILPQEGFLPGLRRLCDQYGALLIFDEVMSGFRVALGGAQELYGVGADLSTFGKVIGAGLPVGAFGGRREIMQRLAPLGGVYQAGTLSGNLLVVGAALAVLKELRRPGFFPALEQRARQLSEGLRALAEQRGVPLLSCHAGGMFGFHFNDHPAVRGYREVQHCNREQFRRFFHAMLEQGVYLAPSPFEAGFVSAAHDEACIARTLEAAAAAFKQLPL